MRWKCYIVAATFWLVILSSVVVSKTTAPTYTLQLGSDTRNSGELKQEILDRYRELIRGVHEESTSVLLVHNLDWFMWEDSMNAQWENGELLITVGDGKGAVIHGDLDPQEQCLPEVKTKSLLMEWLNGE